jgi:hypothetical protein
MSDPTVWLVLIRVASAVALVGFVGVAFWIMWRDLRTTTAELETRRRQLGRLVVVSSAEETLPVDHSFPLHPHTTIGRAFTNTVQLDFAVVSATHAAIMLRQGRWWIEDLRSSNGTALNAFKIEGSVILSQGDVITIGGIELRVDLTA